MIKATWINGKEKAIKIEDMEDEQLNRVMELLEENNFELLEGWDFACREGEMLYHLLSIERSYRKNIKKFLSGKIK